MQPIIVVHGGAGPWTVDDRFLDRAVQACIAAAEAAQAILLGGGPSLDAVEAAVRLLEDAPELDAGRGSYLNAQGEIELDALIMDGSSLEMGAVAAVQNVRNPITLARRVMDSTPHSFLVGAGAEAFADAIQFPRCTFADLFVDSRRQGQRDGQVSPYGFPAGAVERNLGDTVGAVALDQRGNLAAATSTGGTKGKWPGRVGDSPQVGSGAYADNDSAAVSATGQGEALMKLVISRLVCFYVEMGAGVQASCQRAVDLLGMRVRGQGGVICVGADAEVGIAFNARAMPHAFAVGSRTVSGDS